MDKTGKPVERQIQERKKIIVGIRSRRELEGVMMRQMDRFAWKIMRDALEGQRNSDAGSQGRRV